MHLRPHYDDIYYAVIETRQHHLGTIAIFHLVSLKTKHIITEFVQISKKKFKDFLKILKSTTAVIHVKFYCTRQGIVTSLIACTIVMEKNANESVAFGPVQL